MAEEKKFEKGLEIPKHEMEIADELSEMELERVAGGAVCDCGTCSDTRKP
jgi:hypothetical protein